jgi:hypothetical protein
VSLANSAAGDVDYVISVSAEEILDGQRVVEGKVCRITLMPGHDADQGNDGEYECLPERLKLLRAHQGKELIEQHLAGVAVEDHTDEVQKGVDGH